MYSALRAAQCPSAVVAVAIVRGIALTHGADGKPATASLACAATPTIRADPQGAAHGEGGIFLGDLPVSTTRRKRRSSGEVADRILEAAGEEFETNGYAGATTAAIARRAEVTEAQIFRLFGSKRDLFHAAIFEPLNHHFAEFHARNSAAFGTETTETLARRYISELQDFIEQHSRMLMSLIVASAYSPETREGVGELVGLRDYFARGAAMMTEHMGGNTRADPAMVVRVSFAAVLANLMFRDWLFPAGTDSTTIRRAIGDFVLHGIDVSG
jgi:AcrR family transcriptional regulator